MFNKYIDTLFALYMNEGQASFSWLVDYRRVSMGSDPAEVQRDISVLKSAGLLNLFMTDGIACMALTEAGARLAEGAADILSNRMMEQWQQMQPA